MPLVRADDLIELATRIFAAAGVPISDSRLVSQSLVEANLVGHDSHGVIRVMEYVQGIRNGRIDPRAEPRLIKETASTLIVDGNLGFGPVVVAWTMQRVINQARSANLAAAGISNCGHIGRLGAYVQKAAEEGTVAFAFANGGASEPRVAPHGGSRPVLGTNPLAAGVPSGEGGTVIIDFSTAVAASGKIRVAKDKGELLPEGWILDRNGRPSKDPEDYYDGGMLLPAAGHKGYGLAVLVEILSGLLAGAGSPLLTGWGNSASRNGVFLLVINVEAFGPLAEFQQNVDALCKCIKAIPPIDLSGEVFVPGEPEHRSKRARLQAGLEIPEATWRSLMKAAEIVNAKAPIQNDLR